MRVCSTCGEAKALMKYGLTREDYHAMLAAQRGCCAICERPLVVEGKKTHVDHCHDTDVVRGLLCARCNTGLGAFEDNPDLLERAVAYLRAARLKVAA
jgi:hypothetical protein